MYGRSHVDAQVFYPKKKRFSQSSSIHLRCVKLSIAFLPKKKKQISHLLSSLVKCNSLRLYCIDFEPDVDLIFLSITFRTLKLGNQITSYLMFSFVFMIHGQNFYRCHCTIKYS